MIADFCVTRKARHTSVVVSPSPTVPYLSPLPPPSPLERAAYSPNSYSWILARISESR